MVLSDLRRILYNKFYTTKGIKIISHKIIDDIILSLDEITNLNEHICMFRSIRFGYAGDSRNTVRISIFIKTNTINDLGYNDTIGFSIDIITSKDINIPYRYTITNNTPFGVWSFRCNCKNMMRIRL